MMRCNTRILASLVACSLALSACSSKPDTQDVSASGAKSAVATLELILSTVAQAGSRPGAPLGVFTSIYASQGIILPVQTALLGFDAMAKFLEAHSRSDTDENFAALREIGSVLQVDIVDMLNRSSERSKALDIYTSSLRNAISLCERKMEELEALYDNKREQTRTARNEVRDLERTLRTALKDQDYALASETEEELTRKTSAHATLETQTEQTDDMRDRFSALYEVAQERLQAITVNREILIAGLRVIDVPGIGNLNILEEGARWDRGSSRIFR